MHVCLAPIPSSHSLLDLSHFPVPSIIPIMTCTPPCQLIHSFQPFYSAPSGPLLLRGASDYITDTVSEFHAEAHRQLQGKDLPKVLTWRLERELNPRPSG